jgi:pimeloyl-ACP methyl ester carboxylesterase
MRHAPDAARHDPPTDPEPNLLPGSRQSLIATGVGRLMLYSGGTDPGDDAPVVLLLHSINAAACAAEMRPVFERLGPWSHRYALDLPGYGASDRTQRIFDIATFVEAVRAVTEHLSQRHGGRRIHLLALSLSCEFAARVAVRVPERVSSLGLISPTGLDRRSEALRGLEGASREVPGMLPLLRLPGLRALLFRALVSRSSMRYFLQRTWGSPAIDETLLEACWQSAHRPDALHAPLSFLSGRLFARDIRTIYEALACPVWLAHGVRGDFKDYSGADWTAQRSHWQRQVFDAGAMPHFEHPEAFMAAYRRFLGVDDRGRAAIC